MTVETVEEYLARGGKITMCPPGRVEFLSCSSLLNFCRPRKNSNLDEDISNLYDDAQYDIKSNIDLIKNREERI